VAFDLNSLKARLSNPSGRHDVDTGTMWTSPWRWRDSAGMYIGHNGEAWLYRKVPINPLAWEDGPVRLARSQPLDLLLKELGSLSSDPTLGIGMTANEREIHILSVSWEEVGQVQSGITPELAEFQQACLDYLLPRKVLAIGVKLSSGIAAQLGKKSLWDQLKGAGERALGEKVPDRSQWAADFDRIDKIMSRYGASVPDRSELAQMESWFNLGRGPDVLMKVAKDSIYVDDFDQVEMAVVREFTNQIMQAPNDQWALDASTNPEGPAVISVRGKLQTANAARARARSGLRRRRAAMEEEMATGDIERIEDTISYQQAQQVENYIATTPDPILTECSVVMGARLGESEQTYIDDLRNQYGIDVAPLVMRQLEALEECMPCSNKRVNPFLQDLTIPMLAYCGLQGWSNLGDPRGVFLGLTDPDYTPCYLDVLAAPRMNTPPAFAVFGDPGSGKAQPLDAPILTPHGWSTMGQISPGDRVIGSAGKSIEVLSVHPQGMRQIVRVSFVDGGSMECDLDHLFTVTDLATGATLTLTAADLIKREPTRFAVPLVGPVAYSSPSTTAASMIPALLSPEAADEDFEPLLRSGILTRAAAVTSLLAETDQDKTGRYGIKALDQARKRVIIDLVEGLGGLAYRDSDSLDLLIALPPTGSWALPNRRNTRPDVLLRSIAKIEESRVAPAQCILVDAPDHLYVTESHVVTHNTFLCQLIATQAALNGEQVIFINPKAGDSLAAFAQQPEVNGTVVSMSQLEKEGGYFDPFYYCEPEMAAEVASNFILSVMGGTGVADAGLTGAQEIAVTAGLKRGAIAGARCVHDALRYIGDSSLVELIMAQVEGSSLFGLGIGMVPKESRYSQNNGLTLIEFDRKLSFPGQGKDSRAYSKEERIALAAVRLVTRASLEILMSSGGGVLIVDEAWTFLSHAEGLASLQQIGREGRSLNLLPIFATQRVDDLIQEKVNMESYISRVMVMEMREERDITAALNLCGLAPLPERIQWVRQAGYKAATQGAPERPAMGIHRDLYDRHAAVYVGPVPEAARIAFTTNPEERRLRDEAALADAVPPPFVEEAADPFKEAPPSSSDTDDEYAAPLSWEEIIAGEETG